MSNLCKISMLALLMVVYMFCLTGCVVKSDGKIPITTNSHEARELFQKGMSLADRLQAQESKAYFEEAVKKDPEFALAWMYLSFAQPSAKEFFDTFDEAKALKGKVSQCERLWIDAVDAGVNGYPIKQRELYQKMTVMCPKSERAFNLLGINYMGQQDYDQAITAYLKATEINPEFSTPYNQLGYAYRFLGKYEEAAAAFQKYIELIPDDPNPYDSYAELLLKIGKYDESIANYEEALKHNPNFVASYLGIATNYNLKGEHEAARARLDHLLKIARTDGEKRQALFAKAVSYADEGNLVDAFKAIEAQYEIDREIEDTANMAGDLGNMGTILLDMDKPDGAMLKFKEAIDLITVSELDDDVKANNNRFFKYNAAKAALARGDVASAKKRAEEFMRMVIDANNPNQIRLGHELAGMIAYAEEDFNGSIAEFTLANQLNPYIHYRMGLAYAGMDDKTSAIECLARAADFNSLNNLNYALCRNKAAETIAYLNK